MFSTWAARPWLDTSVKNKGVVLFWIQRTIFFNFLFDFSTTEDAVSEGLKQGFSDLVTGDIASLVLSFLGT